MLKNPGYWFGRGGYFISCSPIIRYILSGSCIYLKPIIDMPYLFHHKRRHSWPYCGPIARSGTASSAPVKNTPPPPPLRTPHIHQPQYIVPLIPTDTVTADNYTNDAASAGIIPSKSKTRNRLWPAVVKNPKSRGTGIPAPVTVSTTTRPRLDKARSLFILPTVATTAVSPAGWSLVPHWMQIAPVPTPVPVPNPALVPVPVPALVPVQLPVETGDRGRDRVSALNGYGLVRRHRRCHSERPRSWREPSASLWTLREE